MRLFAIMLYVLLLGMAVPLLPMSSLAQESGDDFGLSEVDPELPQKIKKWNSDCLSCHSEEGVRNPPRKGMDLQVLARMTVDQGAFEQSDHGKTACKDCHTEAYVPYPHEKNARNKIKSCAECHKQPAKTITPEFKLSEHFKAHSEAFTCLSCHESHTMRKANKIGALSLAVTQDNALCQQCHGPTKDGLPNHPLLKGNDDSKRYHDLMAAKGKAEALRPSMEVAHEWLPEMSQHLSAVRCIDCHSPISDTALSHTVEKKDKAERRCEACHADQTDLGKRLYRKKMQEAPGAWMGFANGALLSEVYVVGGNRNLWLEIAAGGMIASVAGGTLCAMLWRRRQKKRKAAQNAQKKDEAQ